MYSPPPLSSRISMLDSGGKYSKYKTFRMQSVLLNACLLISRATDDYITFMQVTKNVFNVTRCKHTKFKGAKVYHIFGSADTIDRKRSEIQTYQNRRLQTVTSVMKVRNTEPR